MNICVHSQESQGCISYFILQILLQARGLEVQTSIHNIFNPSLTGLGFLSELQLAVFPSPPPPLSALWRLRMLQQDESQFCVSVSVNVRSQPGQWTQREVYLQNRTSERRSASLQFVPLRFENEREKLTGCHAQLVQFSLLQFRQIPALFGVTGDVRRAHARIAR